MKMLPRLASMGALAAAGLLAYAWAGGRPRMTLQTYRLHWPPAAGLRILQLSDLHFGPENWIQRRRFEQTQRILARLTPDVIFLTGDFLHDDAGLVYVERLLRALPPAPLGAYAVLGNHDYAVYSYGELFRHMAEQVAAAATPQHKLAALVEESGRLARLAWNIFRN
jgi:predicted MPP superfamily phosphohydrolase